MLLPSFRHPGLFRAGARFPAGGRIPASGPILRPSPQRVLENHGGPSGVDPSLPYGERLSLLNRGGVGLWDVVASGVRPGSLDQHITQEQPNDVAALLDRFPGIGVVCCNGTASHKYLKRYFPELFLRETLSVIQMPSTSPAAARLTYEQKFRAYEKIMAPLLRKEKKKY